MWTEWLRKIIDGSCDDVRTGRVSGLKEDSYVTQPSANRDWFADVVRRYVCSATTTQTNSASSRALCDLLTAIGFCTQSGAYNRQADGNGDCKAKTPPASLSREILRILGQVGLDRMSVGALPANSVVECVSGQHWRAMSQSSVGDRR